MNTLERTAKPTSKTTGRDYETKDKSVRKISRVGSCIEKMVDPDHVVTAEDVADATGQSIETVAWGWHELAEEQVDTEESELESTDRRRMFSDE
ncbi:hypothetical protein [Halorubrum ezzemoulense]|uniref:Uncharacterized protein n=2 Tax=Halorubrum ezzemoulense TaxID=337243 RepID=A0ABT4Z946_HALEZ|nr:hypothetical protein [Halorubrum ezzemoulense]MDB2242983.1 hypothetical protein [Halorubrum ezzemoulense]MDB2248591.1 hypothetical protein [Halorubrum ezzemoulense]MDB2294273.1 hypothetical protein [Halorubrum ezzemoulense]MDB9252648.1 hypothetical protein [Halorubrum ezzemoulense]MDB9257171.1 hypothetical protein [Halorubrum ezzemoulense]